MTNLAEQAQQGSTRSRTMAAARTTKKPDALKVDRSPPRARLIETPAMVVSRSMRHASKDVRTHKHDEHCVCVWHVIRRIAGAVHLTASIQHGQLKKNGGPTRENHGPGFAGSMREAFASTRTRIQERAAHLAAGPPHAGPIAAGSPGHAGAAAVTPRAPGSLKRRASGGLDR
jgi:hypothetical protein